MHKSRLGALIIDCQVEDLEAAAEFWSAALGGEADLHGDPEGRYVELKGDTAEPRVILQRVEHPSRVHIDIETDDIAAEVARLENLGASVVEVMERWTVMQAPTGHRYCIVRARRDGFAEKANTWD